MIDKTVFAIYKKLSHSTTRRLYQILYPRFGFASKWNFDLKAFACEKVGLSQTISHEDLKDHLRGAIAELEEIGFLARCSESDRFHEVSPNVWHVRFRKATP